ncbi:MAG: PAS domain S-box protein, partial [Anaerolineae bacterium]|nr:PAS domain S-box protein [Anaerolineae bacterium]
LSLFSYKAAAFTQAQAELLLVFATQVGSAIRNAWLYDAVQRHASELEQRVLQRTVEIEQQRKHMQAILDSMDEGVMGALFYEGYVPRIRYINPALYRLLGYHAEEWNIFRMRSETMSLKEYERVLQDVENALAENRMWYSELPMRHKDGHEFEAAITLTRIDTGESRESRPSRVMIVRDISQAKALAAQKARFVANAAHELRTPITNLKTRLYLAAHQPEEIRTHLAVIEKVTEDMRDLIEKLLDLSRFEHGIIQLEKSLSMVQALVARVIYVQTAEAELKEITLETIMPEPPLMVEVDTGRIAQVLTNLVTNAIHHTPPCGKITISARGENDAVVIDIQDTGAGISAEHLPHLFEPFFQVSRRGGGMGLGLSIAKEIVDLHGGEITVRSAIGEGTCFSVRLQLAGRSQIAVAGVV